MNNLITGGAGFIGGHLSKKIDAKIYDRKINNGVKLDDNYDVIYHLAASTFLVEGYSKQIIDDNIILSNKIKGLNKRIVYASSASVHHLTNMYAYSKKYNEELFEDSNATGLRFYNVYGPNDNGVVGKLIKCALSGEVFILNGDGSQHRDFIYVGDVVNSIIDATHSEKKIIEVGTGISNNLITVIKMVEDLTGKKINIQQGKLSDIEQHHSCCLNPLEIFTPLEEGLMLTIKSYL